MFSKLRNWWTPKTPDTPVEPKPANPPVAVPAPAAEPAPELPEVKPGAIQMVNYLRAFAILRKIPFKEFRAELVKLPWRQIAWFTGLVIWLYMTYAIGSAALKWLL